MAATEASGLNDRARATLPPQPCSQLSKPFFISWRLFLKALWPSLLKPKVWAAAQEGAELVPAGEGCSCRGQGS